MKTITREGIKRIIGPVSGSGGSRGAGGGDISLAGLASEAWVEENYISKAFFNRLFTIHSASGVIDPNDPDEEQTIDSIEALVGFWTEQYVSALGQNSGGGGGGGGGGVTLNQPLEAINNAGLSAPTTAGTMLVWYNGSWTYSPGARLQIGGINSTGTLQVSSSVTANSFIKTGGTSNMFLKADGSVDTNTYASEAWVSQHYVSIQFFETLFNAINAQGVKVNANSTTGIDSIKAMFGLWTERYLSALGQNSGGGGGGGVTLNQPLEGINNAGLSAPSGSGILLVYSNGVWRYSSNTSIFTTGITIQGNATAAGYFSANSFIKTGGTSQQILLADGSVMSVSDIPTGIGAATTSTLGLVKVANGYGQAVAIQSTGQNTSRNYGLQIDSDGKAFVYVPWEVPTLISAFTNDAGYTTNIGTVTGISIGGSTPYSPSNGVVSLPAYPSKVSDLTNDAGYTSNIGTVTGISIGGSTPYSPSNGVVSLPAYPSDTKNTAGATAYQNAKLYLIGSTSYDVANAQTYTNSGCYIGTDNCLYSNGSKVLTATSIPINLTVKTSFNSCLPSTINQVQFFKGTDGQTGPSGGGDGFAIGFSWGSDYPNIGTQLFIDCDDTGVVATRNRKNDGTWNSWRKLALASDYLPLTGGTMSGSIEIASSEWTFLKVSRDNRGYSTIGGVDGYGTYFAHTNNNTTTYMYLLAGDGLTVHGNIKKYGGTSSQFLKADGSVDSTNYAIITGATQRPNNVLYLVGSSAFDSTYSQTYTNSGCYIGADNCLYSNGSKVMTAASGYLPITGGNLTGTLYTKDILPDGSPNIGSSNLYYNNGYINRCYFRHIDSRDVANNILYIQYYSKGNTVIPYGTVGIGLEYPSTDYKLDVAGKIRIGSMGISERSNSVYFMTSNQNATFDIGSATAIYGKLFQNTSDIRKKDITDYIDLNLTVISQAPIFNFTWKDYPGTRPSVGTSAQYWEKVLPYAVSEAPDGYLAMDYGATALAAAVMTARKVEEHERRIAELERENKVLWNMIVTLKAS